MKAVCFIAVLTSFIAISYATTAGTRFQLVFMENIVEAPADGPLEVHVSNLGNVAASVTVSSPRTSCGSETKTVNTNSVVRFDVCWWMRARADDYWPAYKTVLVTSDRPVMVYAYNKEFFSADGFYAIPNSELAYSYFLASYDEANIATQFAISATTDTNVQITLPNDPDVPVEVNYRGLVYTNGQTLTLTLSEYETYLGQSRGDITGAKVLSDQPIAVFSGNIRNKQDSGSRDHLAAQLMPTGDWGNKFALQPVQRSNNFGDVVRVIARKANTQFSIQFTSGNAISRSLSSAGSFYEFEITGPCVITGSQSSSHFQVIQMVKSQAAPKISDVADPVMFLLVPQSKWLNEYVAPFLRNQKTGNAYDKNFAFFSVADGSESGLRIDGNTFSASWTRVNGIATAWATVNGFSHRYTHTSNVDFGVMIYGASDRESYGFALGADMTNSGCQASLMMRGDGLDNDCDGFSDEESCNNIDDDGDGEIDEDCEALSVEAFGNEYVLMFMENNVDDNPNAVSLLEIYMSAVDSAATVQYSLTRLGQTINGTIQPNQVEIFTDLPVNLRHTGSGIDSKAVTIKASGDIVVYGINKQTWSTDGFLAFPVDVVGREYYTSHFYPGTDLNEFAFTPAFNDGGTTSVTVTMPSNQDNTGNTASSATFGGTTLQAGQSTVIQLSYGQTAQFQAASNNDNLNGAHIVSDKPIAMFSGNVRARVDPTTANSRDHLVHQLAPVTTWGVEFVTLPIPREQDRGDIFFITASVAGTSVEINIKSAGGSPRTVNEVINNPGEWFSLDIGSTEYAHITATRPVQVFQYVKTTANRNSDNADPAMMLIPPVEQWSRNYQFVTPRTGQEDGAGGFEPFQTFVMIAIDQADRDGLRLDNAVLPSPTWVDLTGSSVMSPGTTFSATVIRIQTTGRHSLSHINSNVYFQALMYGRADRESYALPLGMRLVAQGCSLTTQSEGDGIDNDCDGSVDEELCNNLDDDGDGSVDEDCGTGLSSGTSFYLTYMENTVEYPQDFNLELYVAVVGSQAATVNVRAPLFEFPVYNTMTEVQPGKVQPYGFSWYLRNEGQGITGKTIYVRANSEVVVYGVNKEKFSNDAFLVYPENSLGTNYYTCSWSPSTLQTEFAVVATQDNTNVQITLPSNRNDISVEANNQVYTAGQSFTVSLNRFQVYQGQSAGDLTGTRIQTNNRAAVFSGNVRTKIELSGSRDHLVQQMLPTNSYGSQFYVVPFPQRTVGDVLRIVAAQSNTVVRVNGNVIGTIGSAGGFIPYSLSSSSRVTLTASSPVMVIQFMKSQDGRDNQERADPAMFTVPSSNNFVTSATFITPVYSGGRNADEDYTNYVTLVILNGQQGDVRFNGNSLQSATWNSISGSNHVTTTFNVPSGMSHTITTTSGASFYGRLYGLADRESYAFPIGFRF